LAARNEKKMERRLALTDRVRANHRNALLAALPQEVLASLRAHLKPVSLPRGMTLCEAEQPLSHIHFVEAGAVSLVTVFKDGTTAEMATVGREGMVEVDMLMGGERALGRYVVVLSGFALAVEASRFQSALREMPALRATCEVYAQAFLANLLQNVACNATHSVEQRCARWLLMCDDQVDDDSFELTQEYLADVLGVRRSTVTVVARTLQDADLIRYRRGAITVLDRRGLEAAACQCYRIVRDGYERALTRTAEPHAAQDRRQRQRGSARATPSRSVADQWPEAEPEE
jgi:CRP-like cAMP-binding protein